MFGTLELFKTAETKDCLFEWRGYVTRQENSLACKIERIERENM
jgi:hypothetical protein